jgi:hypothetical protein
LLARHLRAEPGMTNERSGNDLHRVADPWVLPSALCVSSRR